MTAFIAKDILNNLKRIQDNLLDTVTNIFNGKVNFHLLSPYQLWHELNIISGQLPKDYALPVENADFTQIYNLMKIRARITKKYILLEIKIPLISRDSYEIFQMIPIPRKLDEQMIKISPISEYTAISLKRDTFLSMTEKDISSCLELGMIQLLCHIKTPEYRMTDDSFMCKTETNPSECTIIKNRCTDQMTKLHTSESYLYFCCNECRLKLICEDQITGLQLSNAGLLTVGHGCLIKSKEFTVYTHKQDQTKIVLEHKLLTPNINPINNIINISLPHIENIALNATDVADHHRRLSAIEKQINNMKQEVPILNDVSSHDIHHYAAIYIIVVILALVGVAAAWRQFQKCRRKDVTSRPAIQPGVSWSGRRRDSVVSVVSDNTISASVDKATSPIVSKSVSFKEFDST
ncbi:uncharacterized protein LOC115440781 [Manduca sexta]|uniref:uncharacterized protein LOC115440781 n=1 Tax=Manduca sexta TaxID=7130 RepID=UPI00188FF8C7|nr:uncharacterized protein LOC115440781 [Manduca sexta]